MGRLSCTWRVCGRFCDAKRTLLQCLSGVFAALNGCVAALFQRKTDVFAVFVLTLQLVEGHFCLLNRCFSCTFAVLNECVCGRFCEAKRTLLQCLSDVFATLNVCVCGAFSAQNGRVCDVFGVFALIVQLVEGHFLLVKWGVFSVLGVFVDAFATQSRRFCNVFRACLRR